MYRKNLEDYHIIKTAAVVPELKVADPVWNALETIKLAKSAYEEGARVILFPELNITGYTASDLFHQRTLWDSSLKALKNIMDNTSSLEALIFVGMPRVVDGMIFNVAAVINKGELVGIVPKTSIPGYKEFYEERWFSSARDLTAEEVFLFGKNVPIGTNLLFQHSTVRECIVAAEICEDVWTPLPPSNYHAIAGATIIVNLSASNELVGKAKYRRRLISTQSARNVCAYLYTSSGVHESTTDVVFGGHAIIAENGSILSESVRFERKSSIIYGDIDLHMCTLDRVKTTSFGESIKSAPVSKYRTILVDISPTPETKFSRNIHTSPFVPEDAVAKAEAADEIIEIQAASLAKRLEQSGIKKVVLGLSGGLDSTLALLIAKRTFDLIGLPTSAIQCITMPGLATSEQTKSNAWKLANAIGASIEEIPISKTTESHFSDIGHDGKTQDITYENAQARYRTMILMDKANQLNGIVLGTGDLSEIALGWCTYSGDHLSHYNVNASIPKTLVQHLVRYFAETKSEEVLRAVLKDILDTPISPELKKEKEGEIEQKTEDIIGPYELHDFFLYYFIRWGIEPWKISWLAKHAFKDKYQVEIISKWLKVFITRFFRNQWKRSVMPDGPKVGSVALSPRGDWRMPSDAELNIWLAELE